MDRAQKQKSLTLGFIHYSGTDILTHSSFNTMYPLFKMSIAVSLEIDNASQGYFL